MQCFKWILGYLKKYKYPYIFSLFLVLITSLINMINPFLAGKIVDDVIYGHQKEILLQKGLNALLKGRTSFIIAHRLSTIKNSTKIMYIDKGIIVESGTHQELLKKKGYYYNLYKSQYAYLNVI